MTDKKLLDVNELAEYLHISFWTIYQWKSQGKIPFLKVHGRLLFDLEKVLNFFYQKENNNNDIRVLEIIR